MELFITQFLIYMFISLLVLVYNIKTIKTYKTEHIKMFLLGITFVSFIASALITIFYNLFK